MKKVFITGSESFVGRELVKQCKEEGYEVHGVDMVEEPSQDYAYTRKDIREQGVESCIPEGVDALIHLAAISRDSDCTNRGYECFDVNVLGTLNLIRAAEQRNVKQFIFASSEWVYICEDDKEQDEESLIDVTRHASEYALSKFVSEQNLRQKYTHGFCSVTNLRFGIIYGPRTSNWSAVEAVYNAVKNKDVVEVGSLKTGRRFVHVSDTVRGIIASIGTRGYEIINLTADKVITLEDIIRTSERLLGKKVEIREKDPEHASVRNPSNKKAKSLIGWSPQISLEKGLKTLEESKNDPLVSICIPAYNSSAYISRALQSCLSQTYQNIEIVVGDNASTDKTREVVLEYAKRDSRIKFFENESNIGSGNNYLKCAEYATGEYVQALASDDWLSRNYIEEGVQNFLANPKAGAIFANMITLEMVPKSQPRFLSRTELKSGKYSAKWFFQHAYRHPYLGSMGYQSLMRRDDFVKGTKRALSNPENLLDRGDRLEPIDVSIFWEVLVEYDYFVVTEKSAVILTVHGKDHVGLQGDFLESEEGLIKHANSIRHAYETFYTKSHKLQTYVRGIRILFGIGVVGNMVSRLLQERKCKVRDWRKRMSIVKKIFFKNYSIGERYLVYVSVPPYLAYKAYKRYFDKLFSKTRIYEPRRNHFLTEDLTFRA